MISQKDRVSSNQDGKSEWVLRGREEFDVTHTRQETPVHIWVEMLRRRTCEEPEFRRKIWAGDTLLAAALMQCVHDTG